MGKTIVVSMLTAAGFNVLDLGINVPAIKFVEAAKDMNADIVASCALLTTSKIGMQTIEKELEKAGLRKNVKTMIRGAAVTSQYAHEIGADGYGTDAFEAVILAR
ncbi:MAG: cobalamin-dependent protein [Anaerolineales bacterium]|nr:cobalamin-dependent protein [Anaerolineales bacterium]